MSLISEALKKAQAQRQGGPGPADPTRSYVPLGQPSAPTGAPATPVTGPAAFSASPERAPKWGVVMGVLVSAALLFALSAAAVVWAVVGLNRDEPAPAAPVATTLSADAPMPAPEPAALPRSEPAAVTAEASPAAPVPSLEPESAVAHAQVIPTPRTQPGSTTPPAPEPVAAPSPGPTPAAPVASAPGPTPTAPVAAAVPVNAPQRAVPPAPPAPPAPPDPATRAYLASLEVRGVMTGGQKILLFDPSLQRSRAFSPEDLVDAERGLRVTAITENRLEFTDERGAVYTKRF